MKLPSVKKTRSPLDLIPNTLSIFRTIGGWQLEPDVQGGTLKMDLASHLRFVLFNVVLGNLNLVLILIGVLAYSGLAPLVDNPNFSKLDTVSAFSVTFIGGAITVAMHVLLARRKGEIQKLEESFAEMSLLFDAEEIARRSFAHARRWIARMSVVVLLSTVAFAAFIYLFAQSSVPQIQREHPLLYWSYVVTGPLYNIGSSFNPMIMSVDFVLYYLVHFLKSHFEEWRRQMGSQEITSTVNCGNKVVPVKRVGSWNLEFQQNIDLGMRMCQLVKSFNAILAPFVLCQICFCVSSGTFSIFNSTSVLFDFKNRSRCAFSVSFVISSAYLFLKTFYYCTLGQALEDEIRMSKETFAKYSGTQLQAMDESSKFRMKMLLSRLASSKAIFPKSFFMVDHNMFVIAMAAIFTNLIVLLQFRTHENK